MKLIDVNISDKELENFFAKLEKRIDIINNQIERFQKNCEDKELFIEKVIKKYESDEYKNKWYDRGCEPPTTLYWFLFRYAEKYGRKPTLKEKDNIEDIFVSDVRIYKNYVFLRVDGQGSFINVYKLNDLNNEKY
jgi:hypothetical protein